VFLELNVSPNPSNGVIALYYKLKEPQSVQIELFNLMGKLIGSNYLPESEVNTKTIEFMNAPSGIYFIKLKLNSRNIVKKIIKY